METGSQISDQTYGKNYAMIAGGVFSLLSCLLFFTSLANDILAYNGATTKGVLVSHQGFSRGSVGYLYVVDGKRHIGYSRYPHDFPIEVGDEVDVYYCSWLPIASSLEKRSSSLVSNSIVVIVTLIISLTLFRNGSQIQEAGK